MQKWDTRVRTWEVWLLIVTAIFLIALALGGRDQRRLSQKVLRLHVLANSDTEEDQALKLKVRDAVLARAQPLLDGVKDRRAAQAILSDHLEELEAAGREAAVQEGYDYPVHAELRTCYFPTRHYTDFSLPAGEYEALRVEIGEARGHNWWCVVYPPLCAVGMEEMEPASAGLTEEDCRLITQDSTEYVIRFRCMEWFSQLEQNLSR